MMNYKYFLRPKYFVDENLRIVCECPSICKMKCDDFPRTLADFNYCCRCARTEYERVCENLKKELSYVYTTE